MIFVEFEKGDRGPLFQIGVFKKNNTPALPASTTPYPQNIKKKYQILLNNK